MPNTVHVSRERVRDVECPSCLAPEGEKCVGARRKVRESNHQERVNKYVRINKYGRSR